jgi:membrane protease YdiL (CAAX protease family)
MQRPIFRGVYWQRLCEAMGTLLFAVGSGWVFKIAHMSRPSVFGQRLKSFQLVFQEKQG